MLKKNTNELQLIVIHCSDTVEGRYFDKRDIMNWHTKPVSEGGRGWSRPGYSDIVLLDGTLQSLVPFDTNSVVDKWELTNGASGYNAIARHICYIGGKGLDGKVKDTRTKEQLYTLETYIRYMLLRHPNIKVCGHNQLSDKACPSFNVPIWLDTLGIDKKHIFV